MKLWDRLSKWQTRGLIVVGLIGMGAGMSPVIKKTYQISRQIVLTIQESQDLQSRVAYMNQYIQTLSWILMSELDYVDLMEYQTEIALRDEYGDITGTEIVRVRVRQTRRLDVYVFVPTSANWRASAGVYPAHWNYSEECYTFTDQWGDLHLVYPVGEKRPFKTQHQYNIKE